jgi:Glycosyl transferase family 2
LRSQLERLRAESADSLAALGAAVAKSREDHERTLKSIEDHERTQGDLLARLAWLENLVAIDAVTRFIRHARLRTEPLVTVVLPTYDRPAHLRRAIESVLAQRYTRWELVVVDDGGTADSQSVTDETGDDRVRWMRIDHRGVCAARNAALAHAGGEIITYLDDDNLMDPDWLYSVVWAFEQRPDIDVLYGAFVVDDLLRVGGESSGQLPRAFLHTWNREVLRHGNLADIGAIAHRSGLPEARFDEGLTLMGDWDLLLRLTAERDPLVLPAVACYYMTDAPGRLTGGPTHDADRATVVERAAVVLR